MPMKGVDLSHWNINVDFGDVKRAGGEFAIIKSSQGDWVQHTWNGAPTNDGHRRRNFLQEAKNAGFLVGAYHFITGRDTMLQTKSGGRWANVGRAPGAGVSQEIQVRTFINAIKNANHGTLDGVLACLDVEALNTSYTSNGKMYRWQSRPDKWDIVEFEREFHRREPGRPLVIYTTSGYWNGIPMERLRERGRTYLWLAWWVRSRGSSFKAAPPTNKFSDRFNSKHPSIWQYGILSIPGISGVVDCNVTLYDRNGWKALTKRIGDGNPDPGPDPDPGPNPDPDPDPNPDPQPNPDPWTEPWYDPINDMPTPTGIAGASAIGGAGIVVGLGLGALLVGAIYLAYTQSKVREPIISALQDLRESNG